MIMLLLMLHLLVPSSSEVVFMKEPVDSEVLAGKTTKRFDCILKASSLSVTVNWIHTDQNEREREYPFDEITKTKETYKIVGKTSEGDFSLIISNATETDAGVFQCKVRQEDGFVAYSTKGTLTVLFPPADGYPQCSSSKLQNGKTELNCIVDSKASKVNMNWTKRGESKSLGQDAQVRELSTTITLNDNDNGVVFRCSISGESVDSDMFCNITPMSLPPSVSFQTGLTETSVAIGGSVTLKCDSIGKPYISTLRWFYGDRPIERTSGRFR
ncbi:uncharacterized protein [Antedon mediterranea]|uniref:uncharacterized protein n=1 Tax=Antedon mediterranea TaxID=105859 RepID=UPI003AF41C69